MTETSMTAVVEYGPNQLKLESVPIPTAAANEVVIEVEACGVCTSDVKAWHGAPRYWGGSGQPKWIREPVVPGHEFIGHIVELGSEVEGFSVGERVITDQIIPCGRCRIARADRSIRGNRSHSGRQEYPGQESRYQTVSDPTRELGSDSSL